MITVGLTGGIGSGKTEVARLLAERGAVVVDADALAREALAPGSDGLARVQELFGQELVAPDGSLDRAALGRLVFGDPEKLASLEAVVHPHVGRRSAELMASAPADAIVVYDVPLLVEKGLQDGFDVVVVVDAPDDSRLHRLVELRGMRAADARRRMAAQAGREERLAVADHIVANDADLSALEDVVDRLWADLVTWAAARDGSSTERGDGAG